MKQHFLSTGTKFWLKPSLLTPCGASVSGQTTPEARNPRRWPRQKMLGKALSTVRDVIRTSEAGLANPASAHQFRTLTSPHGIHKIFPAPPSPMALDPACQGPPSEFSICFFDVPADNRKSGVQHKTSSPLSVFHCANGIKLPYSISTQPTQVSNNENPLNRQTRQRYPVSHTRVTLHYLVFLPPKMRIPTLDLA